MRWKIDPRTWTQLSESQQIDVLAYDLYITRELREVYDKLFEQKGNTPEVVFLYSLTELGFL